MNDVQQLIERLREATMITDKQFMAELADTLERLTTEKHTEPLSPEDADVMHKALRKSVTTVPEDIGALIERLEGHVETLRGVASGVYSDDIAEAADALERLTTVPEYKQIGDADEFWQAYQLGQGSADHTAKQVFCEVIQPLIDYARQRPTVPEDIGALEEVSDA